MSKSREQGSADRYYTSGRRLNYGSISLVPMYTGQFPYDQERCKDIWHIPGRTIMSTDALVTLANRRGITVTISEYVGITAQTTRLN